MLINILRTTGFQTSKIHGVTRIATVSSSSNGGSNGINSKKGTTKMMSDSVPPKNIKDRHRRRPVQQEEPDYFDEPPRRTSPGPKSNQNFAPSRTNQNFGQDDQKRSADPWKVLVKKLDTTKGAKEKFGKVVVAKVDNTVDELQCVHYDSCAGCSMKGNFSDAPIVKRAKNFFASENLNFPTTLSDHIGWRTHVKLAVRPLSRWGGIKIGLFKAGSHDVLPIPDCKVHHPRINEAVEFLKAAAMEVGVKGYQEASNGNAAEGELRYIQMSIERETQKIQVVLVWNVFTFKEAEQTLPRLVKRLKGQPQLFHSVYANFQTSPSNVILNYNAKAWKLLWGPPSLKEKVGNANFFFSPQIFRQSNLDAFEKGIIPAVIRHIPEGSSVAELYSGIGVLGLNAAHKAKAVLCSDSNEYVDAVFDKCADTLPEGDQDKVFYENLNAEESIAEGQCNEADVLIVDPPRKGLDDGVLRLLLGKHEAAEAPDLKRVIYISCGFDALERDTRALLDSNIWQIRSTEGFILFPGSDHVETIVVFDKKGVTV